MLRVFIFFFLIISNSIFGQKTSFNGFLIDYSYQIPLGGIAETFTNNSSIGINLITKKENSIKKGPDDWSETYEIDPEIFPYRCGYSTKYTDEALIYLKRLYEEKTK